MPAAKRSPYAARTELYGSWNVAEDAKQKSAQLADAATKEYEKASQLAQQTAGKIELYSGKYYACASLIPHHPPSIYFARARRSDVCADMNCETQPVHSVACSRAA